MNTPIQNLPFDTAALQGLSSGLAASKSMLLHELYGAAWGVTA
jgi:hypothetical protein